MISSRTSAAAGARVISRAVQRSNRLRFSANPSPVVSSTRRPPSSCGETKNVESPFGVHGFATASGAYPELLYVYRLLMVKAHIAPPHFPVRKPHFDKILIANRCVESSLSQSALILLQRGNCVSCHPHCEKTWHSHGGCVQRS
jgi:hypothetical protein